MTTETGLRAFTAKEIQEEFVSHAYYMVDYWVNNTHYAYSTSPLSDRLSGLMHSIHVTLAGNSGGFNASVDMYMHSTPESIESALEEGLNHFPESFDVADDINDGSLQYHNGEEYPRLPAEDFLVREWNADEMRKFYQYEVASLLERAVSATDKTELEKGYDFLRSYLNIFDEGLTTVDAKITLVAASNEENREYFIEQEENYYEDATQISGITSTLVEVFDRIRATS